MDRIQQQRYTAVLGRLHSLTPYPDIALSTRHGLTDSPAGAVSRTILFLDHCSDTAKIDELLSRLEDIANIIQLCANIDKFYWDGVKIAS